MLIVVDPHSGVPVYRQLMDQVKFHVASGLLQAGDELPSTRSLSSQLGINPMTISKAYSYLEKEDVVERRPGRPLVVKAVDGEQIMDRKIDRVRESLAPGVNAVRQLGVDHEEAVRVFRDMLGDGGERRNHKPSGESS
ncbi:MAG: GntR family transcriptional regulator [Candidatus Krumholzibacteriia bacterium]